jgi:hypothetical protein
LALLLITEWYNLHKIPRSVLRIVPMARYPDT